jgi:plasmid stabilization system protein ParE
VARLVLSAGAEADLDRLYEFLAATDPVGADALAALVLDGLSILERFPLVGRPAEHGKHELVISRGRSGYVALYEYVPEEDVVLVLAIRHQREAGYPEER